MIALWQWPDKRAAMSAEARLKRLTREEKLALATSDSSPFGGKRVPVPGEKRAEQN